MIDANTLITTIFGVGFYTGYIVCAIIIMLVGFIISQFENARFERFLRERKQTQEYKDWCYKNRTIIRLIRRR